MTGRVEARQGLRHGGEPDPAVLHADPLLLGCLRAVVALGHDRRVRAVRGEPVAPPVAPPGLSGLRRARLGVRVAFARFRLPADQAVLLELDHVVVHLVVAVRLEVHLHHEHVPGGGHRVRGDRAAEHSRAVELQVPHRVGQHRENLAGRRFDPPRHRDRLAVVCCHRPPPVTLPPVYTRAPSGGETGTAGRGGQGPATTMTGPTWLSMTVRLTRLVDVEIVVSLPRLKLPT